MFNRIVTTVALLLFPLLAQTAGPDIIYPGAEPIESRIQKDTWYILALGSMTRSGGGWRPAATERFRGDLYRLSYQLPDGHSAPEAHEFYLRQLQSNTEEELFDCEGRDCGSSNYWANQIFGVKELYGLDGSQRYTALRLSMSGEPVIAAIYSIERANRRSYVHIDWLKQEVSSGTQVKPAEMLRSGQAVTLLRQKGGWDRKTLGSIAGLLEREPDLQLYVVGHAYGGASLETMLNDSVDYAKEVVAILQQSGVPSSRLGVHGVGPLAPGLHAVDRVVLVRH